MSESESECVGGGVLLYKKRTCILIIYFFNILEYCVFKESKQEMVKL